MTNNKFLATLGLARRAGKITYGFDMVTENLPGTQIIFTASDLSDRTRKSLNVLLSNAGKKSTSLPFTMAQLAAAIGTKPTGIIGITEKGFAALLAEEFKKMNAGGTQL